jgi:PKHD-type hydroxylase
MFPRIVRPEVCNKIIEDCKNNDLEIAKVNDGNEKDQNSSRNDPDIRKTSIYWVPTKVSSKANDLAWYFLKQANKEQFHYDLEFFQAIQFAEYKNGGFYDWHQDSAEPDAKNNVRKLSLSFILSDPDTFEGGELQFWNGNRPMLYNKSEDEKEQIKNDLKAQGTMVIFDSRDWHRVTPVTKGVRYSVVCWSVGTMFK